MVPGCQSYELIDYLNTHFESAYLYFNLTTDKSPPGLNALDHTQFEPDRLTSVLKLLSEMRQWLRESEDHVLCLTEGGETDQYIVCCLLYWEHMELFPSIGYIHD